MSVETTHDILNRLFVVYHRSLANFLMDAPPYWVIDDARTEELLSDMVSEQRRLADRIGQMIVEQGGAPVASQFPAKFFALHDLSSDYMFSELIRYQVRTIEANERLAGQLPEGSMAQALAQEALGVAKARS